MTTKNIRLRIINANTEEPIQNAKCYFLNPNGSYGFSSDIDGFTATEDVEYGTYTVRLIFDTEVYDEFEFVVDEDTDDLLIFEMHISGGPTTDVKVFLKDEDTGEYLNRGSVSIINTSIDFIEIIPVDENPYYYASNVPVGKTYLAIHRTGYYNLNNYEINLENKLENEFVIEMSRYNGWWILFKEYNWIKYIVEK